MHDAYGGFARLCPAESPSGHAVGLREAVDHDQSVTVLDDSSYARCYRLIEDKPLVHLVGQDPYIVTLGELAERALLIDGDHPTGWIRRAVDDQHSSS